MRRSQFLFWLDIVLLLLFAVDQEPRPSGLPAHEWIGIILVALLLLHLLVNWRWVIGALRRFGARERRRSRIATVLNASLFVAMALTIYSGIAISEYALPPFGIAASPLQAWHDFHEFIAGLTEVIVGLHIALNWDWIRAAVRKVRERHHGHGALTLWSRLGVGSIGDVAFRTFVLLLVSAAVSGASIAVVRAFTSERAKPSDARLKVPDLGELPEELAVQLTIVGVSALAGRKVLRLRL